MGKIDIALISVDKNNYRYKKVSNEIEAITLMLSNEKKYKILELADDIVEQKGLDPSSLLIVTPDIENDGRFIALEGNRRITALKALITPALAHGTSTYIGFKSLSAEFLRLGISSVDCVVMDRKQASIWVKRKHYKGIGGKGVVGWDAVATARSDADEDTYARWYVALGYLTEKNLIDKDVTDWIEERPTTVERVLTSRHMWEMLGVYFDNDKIRPENGNFEALTNLLYRIFKKMAVDKYKETQVSSKEQQKEFLEKFVPFNVKELMPLDESHHLGNDFDNSVLNGADNEYQPKNDQLNNKPDDGLDDRLPKAQPLKSNDQPVKRPQAKPVRVRRVLAKPGLTISDQNLNQFYSELRKIEIGSNKHICHSIIRVFLEKVSVFFLDEMAVPAPDKRPEGSWQRYDVKLKLKVDAVLRFIDPNSENPRLQYAREIGQGVVDKAHSMEYLNSAIHGAYNVPSEAEIRIIWDRLHPYFKAVFDEIEKKPES